MNINYVSEKKGAIPPPKPDIKPNVIVIEESVGPRCIQKLTLNIAGISVIPSVFVSIMPSTAASATITEVTINKVFCDLTNITEETQLVRVAFLVWP